MKKTKAVFSALTVIMLSAVSAAPQESARDTVQQFLDAMPPGISEAEVNAIAHELIAPCCWSQTADVHRSEAAQEIRNQIRSALQKGHNQDQIIAAFVESYGERILAKPTATGFNLIVWILPAVAFAAGGFIVWRYLRRVQPRKDAVKPVKAAVANERYEARFERELAEFDA
jgi:cytochrome c-type biogenesis protein CcmH